MNFSLFTQQLCGQETPSFFTFDFSTAPPLLFYSYIPIVIFCLVITFFVKIKSKKSLPSRWLLVFNIFFVFWVVNILFQWVASYHTVLMLAWQLTAFFEVGMFISASYFTYVFLFQKDINYKGQVLLYLIMSIVALFSSSSFNVESYDINNCEGVLGGLWNIIYMLEPAVIVWIAYLGFSKIRNNIYKANRTKEILFVIGMIFFLSIFFLSNFYGELTKVYEFNLWGPLGMVVFLGFLAYITLKFNVFNLKVFSAQILILSLIVLIFSLFFVKDQNLLYVVIFVTLLIVTIFGVLLIKSVKREILQREKIELLAADLGKANTRLLELDKQKSEFVSFATHQLRAPLTAMKGYTSLILEGELGKMSDEVKQAVSRIFDSSSTLANIVDDYLNISRIELGTMKYSFDMLDLKEMVESVIGELKPNIDKKGLSFSFSSKPSGKEARFMVHADKDKLKQVIANLIDNSVKYTPSGSVAVSLSKDSTTRKVLFSIKDTGVGIAPEVMPKLFMKFVRADNANKQNIYGTGLGLFVAKEIVSAHKGRIWAESQGEGKGSSFFLELDMEV